MSTASYGRSRSGDRFYNPPAVRRQLELQQQEQNQQQLLLQKHKQQEREEVSIRREKHQQQLNYHHQNQLQNHQHQSQNHQNQNQPHRRQKPVARVKSSPPVVGSSGNRPDSDECVSSSTTTATNTPAASVSSQSNSNLTNLDRFLEHTKPLVPAQYFSKKSMKGWRTQEDEYRNRPYFVLGDLWESFKEWSAYGAGVPLLLNGSDSVVQYYVPYLSGIQLYRNPTKPSSSTTRRAGEESDESSRETSSAGSSDCEADRRTGSSAAWRQQRLVESTLQGINGLSIRNNTFYGSSSDEGESSSSAGALFFEYLERELPFDREPLADKMSLLASRFSELRTCRSCDLSPSSWISVAWYPIYRIPTGPTLQNLDSCFLTFHYLSTPVSGAQNERQCQYGSFPKEVPNGFNHRTLKLSLPVFGMASYKFRISVWDHNGVDESPKASALLRAADDWLRLLNVDHPDYKFFISRNYNWR